MNEWNKKEKKKEKKKKEKKLPREWWLARLGAGPALLSLLSLCPLLRGWWCCAWCISHPMSRGLQQGWACGCCCCCSISHPASRGSQQWGHNIVGMNVNLQITKMVSYKETVNNNVTWAQTTYVIIWAILYINLEVWGWERNELWNVLRNSGNMGQINVNISIYKGKWLREGVVWPDDKFNWSAWQTILPYYTVNCWLSEPSELNKMQKPDHDLGTWP